MSNIEEIELENEFIVLAIPRDTIEVTISAKVYHDGTIQNVSRTMGLSEIREAFKEAEQGYVPSDAVFTLTPLGEQYVEELIKKQRNLFKEE